MTTKTTTMRAAWKPNNLPEGFVYTGRRFTRYGFDLPEHPLNNPFTIKEYGDQAVSLYVDHLLSRPDLIRLAESYRGWTLVCWNHRGELCHNAVLSAVADSRPDLIPAILDSARHDNTPRLRL